MAASQKPSLLCRWSLWRDQKSPPHSAHRHRRYSSFLRIEQIYHSHLLKISRPHLSATCSAEKLLNFSSYLPRSPAPISCRTRCVWLSLVLLIAVLLSLGGNGIPHLKCFTRRDSRLSGRRHTTHATPHTSGKWVN